ncbi:alanine dehydrogenase [Ruegeria atlantica]|uniref:alanine dehydrogenase n=1 Tax=Ruegeria atlantica TaxID=81569 RepID=UPI00147D8D2E|nr:alanine dehydrogenase [Ruegeria atlantica]
MKVGVPTEIKANEHRVGLTPAAVSEYVAAGHEIVVQSLAGAGIGASDETYRASGAIIADTAEEIFATADMIVKVKEPQASEYSQLREGQILYTYLHLAPDPEQTRGLLSSGCTAIAYETVTDADATLPLLAPMSEVAGRLSIQAAASALEKHNNGEGLLLGGVPGVKPAEIVVIGGGVVGTNAAKMAVGLGAQVTIFDRSLKRLRQLDDLFDGRVHTVYSTKAALADAVATADAVIGAVLIPGAAAPRLVTRDMLATMKEGAALVDVAIDQGGCFETSTATTHENPTYVVDGVVHYCVANMPGAVPKTSSYALNNATLQHGLALANNGLRALDNPFLLQGLNVHEGKLTYKAAADCLEYGYCDPREALKCA